MKRLIAPIGRSRLNVLAAIERVKPDQLIAITTEQNHLLTERGIKSASGLEQMDVKIISLSNAFDIESVRDEINQISINYPSLENDYTLISGSTNQICFMCHMHWPGNTVSIKRGLISFVDNMEVQHLIHESQFLILYNLVAIDGALYDADDTSEPLFAESYGFEINNLDGNITILWEIGDDEDYHRKVNQIRDQTEKKSELFGLKTFHHNVRTSKEFKLHREIEQLVSFELMGEEE